MKIDFLHNKIVAETVTEGFKEGVLTSVLPQVAAKYGDGIVGVQMYGDYLSADFSVGKTQYYPLSVKTDSGVFAQWMCWTVKKNQFTASPFGYIGREPLEISLCDAPAGFEDRLSAVGYFDDKTVKINVQTTADITVLSGKYSQSFVDEMARQLTAVISGAFGIVGIEDSNIELALVFAPETYMEHTSDNVTYRRLLFVDPGSAPRDLWIKWTRLSGAGAYSMADEVSAEDILFELGEDVPQKIKEKEYRFLTKLGGDKYQSAMGRKNVTDWRIVLKRAIKRGDLTLLTSENAVKEKTEPAAVPVVEKEKAILAEVEEIISPVEEKSPAATEISESLFTPAEESEEDEELKAAMEMARLALSGLDEEDGIGSFKIAKEKEKVAAGSFLSDEEDREIDEITRMAMEALRLAQSGAALDSESNDESQGISEESILTEASVSEAEEFEAALEDDSADEDTEAHGSEPCCEDVEDELVDEEEFDSEEELEDRETLDEEEDTVEKYVPAIVPEDPTAEEYSEDEEEGVISEEAVDEDAESYEAEESLEDRLRREIEAKLRMEYERTARREAEAEAERLRKEQEQLALENQRLLDEARRSREEWERQQQDRLAEAEQLKAQIEAKLRMEAKERERLAEAARAAIEEQQRLEADRILKEREKLEREKAQEAERRAAEEARIKEEAQRAELARAEAEKARIAAETEAARKAEIPEKKYTYISKTVTLMFRKSVDPNMVTRIHEILKATLEYYGKQNVHMRVKASIPNSMTVRMEFVQFPKEEMELLGNMIRVLGNSNLGIAKAVVD